MSDEERQLLDARVELALAVRRQREARNLSQKQLGELLRAEAVAARGAERYILQSTPPPRWRRPSPTRKRGTSVAPGRRDPLANRRGRGCCGWAAAALFHTRPSLAHSGW
jgi:hypothetical protein